MRRDRYQIDQCRWVGTWCRGVTQSAVVAAGLKAAKIAFRLTSRRRLKASLSEAGEWKWRGGSLNLLTQSGGVKHARPRKATHQKGVNEAESSQVSP